MLTNTLFVINIVCFLSDFSHGRSDEEIFRNDYTYIEAVNSSYKIHTKQKTWFEARRECAHEGAYLFYPENDDEQNAVMSFRKSTQPDINWMFVGISDLTSEGEFETIDGKSVFEVYNNWKSDEPNDANGDEDCVEQDNAGKMNDCKCYKRLSFICKKSRSLSLERNNSYNIDGQRDKESLRNDYTYIEAVNSSYKIHTTPKTWFDAKRECVKEGASLFYPENDDEQNAVTSFRNESQPDIKSVFVGISDIMTEGVFETIDGRSVSEVYNNWNLDEPNDANRDEDCVEQDNAGKMNDCKCYKKLSFICKKSRSLSLERNNSYNIVDGQRNEEEIFWYDYTYIEIVNNFYKIQRIPQTWLDAKRECALEGASLFYPENDIEQNAVMLFRKSTQSDIEWVFLGISDLTSEGEFETIDGKSVSEVYNNWNSDEPNDNNGNEDCVEQDNRSKMNDCKCYEKLSFICKKSRPLSLERSNSFNADGHRDDDIFRNDYTYIKAVNSSYKIHTKQKTWFEARRECAQEGASLFYPENDDEQNTVMSFRKSTQPDIKWVFVGISDLMSEGEFETIDGKSVSKVYSNWKSDEPNNANGDEDCVEQDNAGKMNDCKCYKKLSFICKKSRSLSLKQNNNHNIDGQRNEEIFWYDYTYIETVNNFYKIQRIPQTWLDAKRECALEGASLFYPENDVEQNAVMSFRKSTQPDIEWVFLGISDLTSEGEFETIDGKSVSEVYNNWNSDEPNDNNGNEDCVEQDNAGKMNDCKCSEKLSFICKKSRPLSLEQNNSFNIVGQRDEDIFQNDYTYIKALHSSYKIHTKQKTWFEARRECAQEGANLFYPGNDDEQKAVKSFRKSTQPDIEWVFVGISDLMSEGEFETIDGKSVSEVYNNWKSDEPNDANGDEDCVEQDNAGKMNDCKCYKKLSFICKKSRSLSLERNNSYNIVDGQRDEESLRNDYTYIEAVNSSYKIHTTQKTWFDAKRECAREGASLFYPENDDEQKAVMSFRNESQPDIKSVFVGISDIMTEGVFETIDGKSVSEVYNNWKSDEPNDANGDEDCVEQDNAGKMNDCKCSENFSFICKKSRPLSLERYISYNIDGITDKEFFRNDYTYIESVNSFYKIHTTQQTWFDAKRECAQEGARLFYPENDDEQNAVISFRKETQPDIKAVFLGISDLMSEGVFETIDGKSVSEVYNNWKTDEPNNANGDEDCVEQDSTGKMNDCKCSQKFSFICKKSMSLKRNNSCNIDYSFNKDIGKCYKLHNTPLKWTGAYVACRAEQSHLAVINNRLEADYLAKLTESASKQRIGVNNQLFRGIYHLGFHYRFKEGWQTVRGTPFTIDDDVWWNNQQPIIDEREQCGSMFYNGRLNSIDCDTKSFFICEHEEDSSTLSEEMFQ